MPVYKYRGVTEKGQVISNRIEMDSKQKVIDKLKENNIMPIDITQVGISLRKNKQRKNIFSKSTSKIEGTKGKILRFIIGIISLLIVYLIFKNIENYKYI